MANDDFESLTSKLNEDWCRILSSLWLEKLWNDQSRLRRITLDIRLNIVPFAILPFREFDYAKYICLPGSIDINSAIWDKYQNQFKELSTVDGASKVAHLKVLKETNHLLASEKNITCKITGKKYSYLYKGKTIPDDEAFALGLYKVICSDSPQLWIKYLPKQESLQTDELTSTRAKTATKQATAHRCIQGLRDRDRDKRVFYEEKILFSSFFDKCSSCPELKQPMITKEPEGHYVIPVFFGVTPLYVLLISSYMIDPKGFDSRFLRATIEMIAKVAESIVNDNFYDYWKLFCKNCRDKYSIGDRDKWEAFFNALTNRILGDDHSKREYYSWIHCLPGHSIREISALEKVTLDFRHQWNSVKGKFVSPSQYFKDALASLITMCDSQNIGLFEIDVDGNRHDVWSDIKGFLNTNYKHFVAKLSSEYGFLELANKIDWVLTTCHEMKTTPDNESKIQLFYSLKSVLGKVIIKGLLYRISSGFIYFWPILSEMNLAGITMSCIFAEKYKPYDVASNISINPFDFVEKVYAFIESLNSDDQIIKKVIIKEIKKGENEGIHIICKGRGIKAVIEKLKKRSPGNATGKFKALESIATIKLTQHQIKVIL